MRLQAAALRAQLAALGKGIPPGETPVVAYRGNHSWDAGDSLDVDGRTWQVRPCASSLEIREALAFRAPGAPPLVILTALSHADVGADVLARLYRRRLLELDTWEPVLRAFGAQRIDNRVAREPWLADVLLAAMPPEGFPKVASGTLDFTTAWRHALQHLLGIVVDDLDGLAVLRWTLDSSFLERWKGLTQGPRVAIRRWMESSVGAPAALVLSIVESGHGRDAAPLAVAASVLFRDGAVSPTRAAAAARFERYVGGSAVPTPAGAGFGRAGEALLNRLSSTEPRLGALIAARADDLLNDLGAGSEAANSRWLPSGYNQRLELFANTLLQSIAAEEPGPALRRAAEALEDLQHHEAAKSNAAQLLRASQALRLARYSRLPDESAPTFREAAAAYAVDHSWADLARPALYASETHPTFGRACERIAAMALERREHFTTAFAAAARSWFETPSSSNGLVCVEDFLHVVVAPVLQRLPVLILIVDGMSLAIGRSLAESVLSRSWLAIAPGGDAAALGIVVGALPSTTEVCRTSLLCGALRRGAAADEVSGFAANADLVARSQRGKPPRLFHKADLSAGAMLSSDVASALADQDQRVVGAVVNAVDDHLMKDDMVRPSWSLDYVPVLAALFDAARAAGRAVVMVSDHGHVLDLKISERGVAASADRYRPTPPAAGSGEILIRGPRLLSESDSLVLAASERVRYAGRKNGYHGGASPQELIIPVHMFCPDGRLPEGYSEVSTAPPAWWNVDARVEVVEAPREPVTRKTDLPLFDHAPVPVVTVVPAAEPAWIGALLRSEIFREQRERATRVGVTEDRLRQLLVALSSRGGKMTVAALAERLGMPAGRLPSLVAAAGQLLNFDGYQSLFIEADDVVLDIDLVKTQFQL